MSEALDSIPTTEKKILLPIFFLSFFSASHFTETLIANTYFLSNSVPYSIGHKRESDRLNSLKKFLNAILFDPYKLYLKILRGNAYIIYAKYL
jgi:hypothetical protein